MEEKILLFSYDKHWILKHTLKCAKTLECQRGIFARFDQCTPKRTDMKSNHPNPIRVRKKIIKHQFHQFTSYLKYLIRGVIEQRTVLDL